jgi:hypothetical protein
MIEGVMSSVGMSILLSANVLSGGGKDKPLYINKKEGPYFSFNKYKKTIIENG